MQAKLPLSRQEEKVLNVLAGGRMYKEIASELNISINTVKKHLKNVYRKLQVTNRKHAASTLHALRNEENTNAGQEQDQPSLA
jgi:LuxR family maltose regulon positive regulatory protein